MRPRPAKAPNPAPESTSLSPSAAPPGLAARKLAGLPNLGPKSAAMLAQADIHDLAQLRAIGAVAAYARVKRVQPRASLNLLWALEGALHDEPWQEVAREHRTSLLLALDEYQRRHG